MTDRVPEGSPHAPLPPGLLLIGRKEYVDFPGWGLRRLRAKVDTGAWTSSLDVAHYELTEHGPSGTLARLRLRLDRQHPGRSRWVEAPVVRLAVVKNTGGRSEA